MFLVSALMLFSLRVELYQGSLLFYRRKRRNPFLLTSSLKANLPAYVTYPPMDQVHFPTTVIWTDWIFCSGTRNEFICPRIMMTGAYLNKSCPLGGKRRGNYLWRKLVYCAA